MAQIHQLAGICHSQSGDAEAAQQHLEQAMAFAQQRGDVDAEARALAVLGQLARAAGNLAIGRQRLTDALTLYRTTDNHKGEAQALDDLGNLEHAAGKLDAAVRCYGAAVPIFTELGEWGSVAMVHHDAHVTLREVYPDSAVAYGLLAVVARVRAGDETRVEGAFWALATWLVERQTVVPVDLPLLLEWFDTEQAAQASALRPELQRRVDLTALSSFDPAAEGLLRRSAHQLFSAGKVTSALRFQAVADTIQKAKAVGPRTAAQQELALRNRLVGHTEVTEVMGLIDFHRAVQGEVDVSELDGICRSLTDPVARGVLQSFAGHQTLNGWHAAENATEVLDDAIVRLEDAATALGPNAGAMWWLDVLSDLGSAYRPRLS